MPPRKGKKVHPIPSGENFEIKAKILEQQNQILIEKIKQRDETIANLNDLIKRLRKPI